ncbi:MAG: leucine-rich repeat domain-containing protein [Mycoplasmoidaceae bacterium]|nr:leucine-rich repeat domain-containing protein [Mycoplasmoidaceae bacterium]
MGENCFEGCCDLAQVTTVDGQVSQLESLGDSAFYDCDALNNIVLPDSLQRIGRLCFGNCGGLTNITLPKSLKSIGSCAFESCAKLADDSGPGGEPGFKYSGSSSA